MGVDAVLVAVKAKKYFDYDRDYNVRVRQKSYGDKKYAEIMEGLDQRQVVHPNNKSMLWFLQENIKHYALTEPLRVDVNLCLMEFVRMHPDDVFIAVTDHDFPDCHDLKITMGLQEVKYITVYDRIEPEIQLARKIYDE